MNEWQPIATAPKDGTKVLLRGDPYSYSWATFVASWKVWPKYAGWQQDDLCDVEPTHWMPLDFSR